MSLRKMLSIFISVRRAISKSQRNSALERRRTISHSGVSKHHHSMFVEYDSRGRDPKSLYVAFKSVKASTLYQSQVSRGSDTRPSFGAVEVGEELCVTGYWKHMETHGNTHLTETVQSHHVLEKDGKGPISLVVDVVDGRCG